MTRPAQAAALLLVAMVVLSFGGCAARQSQAPRATADDPQGPVIVRLVGRHQTITVTSGPAGALYSAQTATGKMIVANATLDELRTDHPEVYRLLEPGIAADASVGRGIPIAAENSAR